MLQQIGNGGNKFVTELFKTALILFLFIALREIYKFDPSCSVAIKTLMAQKKTIVPGVSWSCDVVAIHISMFLFDVTQKWYNLCS